MTAADPHGCSAACGCAAPNEAALDATEQGWARAAVLAEAAAVAVGVSESGAERRSERMSEERTRDCPQCHGVGHVLPDGSDERIACPECDGTGNAPADASEGDSPESEE